MNARSAMLFVVVILALQTSVWPQQASTQESGAQGDVNGTVKDTTGAVLPGVLVSIRGSDVSTNTDNTGYFILKGLPAGEVTLTASLPSFAKKEMTVSIRPGVSSKVEIVLELEAQAFSVTVEQITPELMNAAESIGVVTVLPSQVAALPSLGEKDIFRSLQLMPGVSATNEQSSGLYVRGGTPDQNLVLSGRLHCLQSRSFLRYFQRLQCKRCRECDGVQRRIRFQVWREDLQRRGPGGKTRQQDRDRSRRRSQLPQLQRLCGRSDRAQGHLHDRRTEIVSESFQFEDTGQLQRYRSWRRPAGRRIRTPRLSRGVHSTTPTRVLTYTPSAKDTFVFSLYYGKDNYDNSRSLNLPNFGPSEDIALSGEITDLSALGKCRYKRELAQGLDERLQQHPDLAVSHYFKNSHRASSINADSSTSGSGREFGNNSYENNRVNDQTLRWANSWVLGRRNYLEFGAEITRNEVDYNFTFDTDTDTTVHSGKGFVEAFYLQDRYQPVSRLEITPGLRITRYTVTDKIYMEPRLSAIVSATNRLKFKAAGGRYYQFVSDLVRENPMEGDQDFWTLADNKWIPVSAANQFIGGASYESDRFLFDVEGYHKELSGLTTFGVFRDPPPDSDESSDEFDFDDLFFHGSGKAQGVEFLAQKKFGSNTGWITYALGRVMYDFPGISDTPYPASHDSTHEFKIVDSYRWKKFTFSGNWVFATGKPTTEPTGSEEVVMGGGQVFERPTYGATNGSRLPDYHRLDLSTTWDFYRGESTRARAGVSVFNVYNHANVWRREYRFFDGEELTTDVNYLGLTGVPF